MSDCNSNEEDYEEESPGEEKEVSKERQIGQKLEQRLEQKSEQKLEQRTEHRLPNELEAIKKLRQSIKVLKSNFLPHEIEMLKYRIRIMLGLSKRKHFDVIEDQFDGTAENLMDLD